MGYKYLDEQPAPECELSSEELHNRVIEMEIKKYGHVISCDKIKKSSPCQMVYSVKEHKLVRRKNDTESNSKIAAY